HTSINRQHPNTHFLQHPTTKPRQTIDAAAFIQQKFFAASRLFLCKTCCVASPDWKFDGALRVFCLDKPPQSPLKVSFLTSHTTTPPSGGVVVCAYIYCCISPTDGGHCGTS
ncbi:hypothetical protein, partial [Leeia aquatica]|uniref:hypothetical protein n=1 Tax=Leeia aquatica TaxID=2725557 RepID=UPI00197F584C